MLIPSIDLMNGQAVQLVGGKKFEMSAGDPRPIMQRFTRVGTVAIVDLDAALGQGDNTGVIQELMQIGPARVGGGIRSLETARQWLDWGAESIVLGTMAVPELLRQLPSERVIAALDAVDDQVVVDGWRTATGQTVLDRIEALREYVSGYLVTFVEREGQMQGTRLDAAQAIAQAAGDKRVTIAGGITSAEEIAQLDQMRCDAQVGMALYKGVLPLADAFAAPLRSDRADQLWPTVVVDEFGQALGLAYSSHESLAAAIEQGRGIYHSRTRGLWIKGQSSGDTQHLVRADLDCDRDTLRFTVRQDGRGFCHLPQRTCWGVGQGLPELFRRLMQRADEQKTSGSYTKRLLADPSLLRSKILEEAQELVGAQGVEEVSAEAADLIYFTMVRLIAAGATWEDVEQHLLRRSLRVSRRGGNAKQPAGLQEN